jgi:hypothetical protein
MVWPSLRIAASAGLALIFLYTSPASSITIATPVGIRQAGDALNLTEPAHCRRYLHRHKEEYPLSRGCGGGADTVSPDVGRAGIGGSVTLPRVGAPSPVGRSPGNFYNPNNPQDRSGGSNPQDRTQPRAINPQDMR